MWLHYRRPYNVGMPFCSGRGAGQSARRITVQTDPNVIWSESATVHRNPVCPYDFKNAVGFQVEEYVLKEFSRDALLFSNIGNTHWMTSAG